MMNSSSATAASASSSPTPHLPIIPQQEYDVFISFRGADTRQTFTSYLYEALCRKHICTFIDDELKRGDPISTLFPYIENSKFAVVIFSQDYASSDWCLNELVKILECWQTRGQVVLPVFYNIDPSIVRNQTGNYAKSFANHDLKHAPETIKNWRNALKEVAALSGWNTAVTRPDALLAKEIAKDVWKTLYRMSSSYGNNLVGIDSKVEEIESMLLVGSEDLCVVGIWGIGGIGKTTLARATFDKLFTKFENAYFIRDIREKSETKGGLSSMREKLFLSMLGGNGQTIECISNFILARHCKKKTLIVFDDVSDSMMVESIIGSLGDWCCTGSRFIITSRDKQVLQNLCNKGKIYKLSELPQDEALQLFCRYSFKQEFPVKGHMELSKKVVEYMKGVPLALKVLDSFLHGKSKLQWESELQKLEKRPEIRIHNVLLISFNELDDAQKKIFLDIGCFFQRESRDFLVKYFDACDFNTEIELAVLIDKCLISDFDNEIRMHDLLHAMCGEIARQESIDDPGKRTRLWRHKDIYQIFKRNTGTQVIEGISLDMSMIDDVNIQKNAIENMRDIRLLKFYCSTYRERSVNKVHVPQGLDFFLNELRYLQWDGYPMKFLQPYFILENLVDLVIDQSNMEHLWEDVQLLPKLRRMSLIRCKELTAMPNLQGAKCFEQLDLYDCSSLRSHSLYANLKFLHIVVCPKLAVIPDLPHNLEVLWLATTGIEELPSSIGYLYRLKKPTIFYCSKLKCLPYNFSNLRSLKSLEILYCRKLDKLPHDLGDLEALECLGISDTAIEMLPSSICKLISLQVLYVSFNRLARLPRDIGDLISLVEFNASCNPIEELPSSIGNLSRLECLTLCRAKLKCLPSSISKLKFLIQLNLCGNEELENQTIWESLGALQVNVPEIFRPETRLGSLRGCLCSKISCILLPQYFSLMDYEVLKTSEVGPPLWLYDAKLCCFSSSISKLKSLIDSDVTFTNLTRLPHIMEKLEVFQSSQVLGTSVLETPSQVRNFSRLPSHNIQCLKLSDCGILEFSGSFGKLSSLRALDLSINKFENLPASIINLSELQSLNLSCCNRLKTLPELPRNLEVLNAVGCSSLENLPSSSIPFSNFKGQTILLGCRKLDKNSLRAVMEDPLLKNSQVIHSKAASVVYPGFEIPEWVNSQSVGSHITLELPLGSFNRKISGMSFCAVIDLPCSDIGVRYKFKTGDDQFKVGEIGFMDIIDSMLGEYDGYHVCIKNHYFDTSLC